MGYVPVETQRVKESRERLHDQQHAKGGTSPNCEGDEGGEEGILGAVFKAQYKHTVPKYSGKLRVGKGEGPQTKVRGRVRDCAEHELDGVNNLVDEHLTKVKLLLIFMTLFLSFRFCKKVSFTRCETTAIRLPPSS